MRLFIAVWMAILAASAQKLNIRLVEGQGAINVIDEKTDRNFAVLLEERYGVPGKEIPVTFTAPSAGASGSFKGDSRSVTVKTNERGYAVARGFRPNKTAGKYSITVTAALPGGGELQSTIGQTNALPTGEKKANGSGRLEGPKKLLGKLRSSVAGVFSK